MDRNMHIFLLKYFWNTQIQNKYTIPLLKGHFHNEIVVSDFQEFPQL